MAESSISPELLPQISALFQDAIDQLAVLGGVSNQGDQSLQIATVVGDEIGRIVDEQRELELVYDELLSERAALQQSNDNVGLNANDQKLRDTAKQLKNSTATLVKALRQKPGAADAIIKVQAERKFVQNALEVALGEIKASRTFEVKGHRRKIESVNSRSARIWLFVEESTDDCMKLCQLKSLLKVCAVLLDLTWIEGTQRHRSAPHNSIGSQSLADVIEEDRHLQETMASTILKEKESRAKIKQLRQQIASVKEQKVRGM
eukprot:TRINITY_DN10176_c0_g1_i6.p1 TRINITY_DN10176_c0_g1~~TRINITY_DN10176_c0_g1_i6.p1  ORF type:complete len:262 (+),score=50.46 TRINITY_DN10176_c0_g1_i6:887-1672(+)